MKRIALAALPLALLAAIPAISVFRTSPADQGSPSSSSGPTGAAGASSFSAALFAPGIVSTFGDEFGTAFSPDGATVFFARRSPTTSSSPVQAIFFSRIESGRWSAPEIARFSGVWPDFAPAFAPDGKRLFFASLRPRKGGDRVRDDVDIWVVERSAADWGEPANLGAPVNSDRNESSPSIAADGTLYFGSDRPGGPGGVDIWRAAKTADGYAATNWGSGRREARDEAPMDRTRIRARSRGRGLSFLSRRPAARGVRPDPRGRERGVREPSVREPGSDRGGRSSRRAARPRAEDGRGGNRLDARRRIRGHVLPRRAHDALQQVGPPIPVLRGPAYFTSIRDGTIGVMDVWRSRLVDGRYTAPENLGPTINRKEWMNIESWIADDESYLLVGAFGHTDGPGNSDIFVSYRKDDGSFGDLVPLGPKVNTPAREYSPRTSLDGRSFFFSSERGMPTERRTKAWTRAEFDDASRSVRNGLGNIYRMSVEEALAGTLPAK